MLPVVVGTNWIFDSTDAGLVGSGGNSYCHPSVAEAATNGSQLGCDAVVAESR